MANVFDKYQPGYKPSNTNNTSDTSGGGVNVFSKYQREDPVPQVQVEQPAQKQTFGSKVAGVFNTVKSKVSTAFSKEKNPNVGNYGVNLLKPLIEDRNNKISAELKKPSPRQNKIDKWNKEKTELENTFNGGSVGDQLVASQKYGGQRNTEQFKGAIVGGVKSMFDGIAQLLEVDFARRQNEANKSEELIKKAMEMAKADGKIVTPEMEKQYIEKYSPRYQEDPAKMKESIAKQEARIEKAKAEGREGFQKVMEIYVEDMSPTNPNFADHVIQGLGSMATYMVASVLVPGGADVMGVAESLSESGSVYEENKKNGMSPTEAFNGSAKTFIFNMVWNTALNKFSGIFDELGEKAVKDLRRRAFLTFNAGLWEGIQEGGQQLRSNIDTVKEDIWEGVWQSIGLGAIIGGGAGSISTGVQINTPGQVNTEENVFEKYQAEEDLAPEEALRILQETVEGTPGLEEQYKEKQETQKTFVNEEMQILENESNSTPVEDGLQRFYQIESGTEVTPWLWGNLEDMRSWAETSLRSGENLHFVDLNPSDVVAQENGAFVAKEGVLEKRSKLPEVKKQEEVIEEPSSEKEIIDPPMGRIQTRKNADGDYQIYWIGTDNFADIAGKEIQDKFNTSKEAREYFKALWIKNQNEKTNNTNINQGKESGADQKGSPPSAEQVQKVSKTQEKVTPAKQAQTPVGEGRVKQSRFQERVKEQLLQDDPARYAIDDATGNFNELNLDKDAKNAVDFLESNPEEAIAVSLGMIDPPAGQTATSISVATMLKAKQEGNGVLYAQILNSNSMRLTRAGQEIVAVRGHFTNDSAENYVKRVIDTRMKTLAGRLVSKAERLGRKLSSKEIITEKVDQEVTKLKKKMKQEQSKVKLAQDIIDSLRC